MNILAWLQDPQNQAAGRNYVSALLGAGAMLGALMEFHRTVVMGGK